MKKVLTLVCLMLLASVAMATDKEAKEAVEKPLLANYDTVDELNPWCGKYCISFFTKTRSAKVVPEGKLLLSWKFQDYSADERWSKATQDKHHELNGEWRDFQKHVFVAKYGWAKDHQIAIGIPFIDNNFNYGSVRNKSCGLGNVFIFEKWRFLKETNNLPAMSLDLWYYLPTGDPDKFHGTDDDAYKATMSISKAWKDFSLHLNPGYTWNKQDGNNDTEEINAAILFTADKKFWPAVEYNYYRKEGKGHAHDIVPGVIWKYRKGGSIKVGVPINIDSTFTYRDRVGLVLKLSQYF